MSSFKDGGSGNSGAQDMTQDILNSSIVRGFTKVADVITKLSDNCDIGEGTIWLTTCKLDLKY